MTDSTSDTDNLINRAALGDSRAANELIMHYRDQLRRMINVRLEPQLRARVDPSDIVQETLLEASEKLSDYLQEQPIPFYPWIRQIAWDQLIRMRRLHLLAHKRSVQREEKPPMRLPDESVMLLARQLVGGVSSPSHKAIRNEMRDRVQKVLDDMEPPEREVLVMWYLEQLSISDIAAVLGLTESGIKSRHRRAIKKLTQLLTESAGEN
jgi:RNA polymerase sigma-70 factor (ECF subfamily)